MDKRQNRHIIDVMFVIALFSLFVMSAIFLISIGASIYSKTMENMSDNFSSRTAVAYIVEKVRQSDSAGAVSVGDFDGNDAIIISSYVGSKSYITYIYEYDGALKELMVRSDITLSPSAGQNMLNVSGFSIEKVNDSLVKCQLLMSDDESYEFFINIHSEAKGGKIDG